MSDKIPRGHKFVVTRGGKHKDQRPERQKRTTKKVNFKKEEKNP